MRSLPGMAAACSIAAVAVVTCVAQSVTAGVVVTAVGRQEGRIELRNGGIAAGATAVEWADVLIVLNDARPGGDAQPEMLHLINGESWAGSITRLVDGRFAIRTVFFGDREVAGSGVRAVDFRPGLTDVDPGDAKMLYMAKGNPVAGSLLWIEADRVAMETPLGVLALTRKEVNRIVYGPAMTGTGAIVDGDEVALADGSVLAGEITPAKEGIILRHQTLGRLVLKPSEWLWVRRHPASVSYLCDARPESVRATPLIRRAPPAPTVVSARSVKTGDAGFVKRLVVWPGCSAAYRLPGTAGKQVRVSAVAGLAPGARGEVCLRFMAGKTIAFERVFRAGEAGRSVVAFEAEGGSQLLIDVEYGRDLEFPCSVTVDDAVAVVM